jgi:hypothetical protein
VCFLSLRRPIASHVAATIVPSMPHGTAMGRLWDGYGTLREASWQLYGTPKRRSDGYGNVYGTLGDAIISLIFYPSSNPPLSLSSFAAAFVP